MEVNANLQNLKPWKPGQSGNPNGRPVGSRQAFSQAFLRDLGEVWASHGLRTVINCAEKSPDLFFATCARILPKDVELTITQNYGALDPADIAILRAIKDAIPDANNREPTSVLEYVRDTLRAAQAKPISSFPSASRNVQPSK